jgi:hypothetical protein
VFHSVNWPAMAVRLAMVAAAVALVGFMVLPGSRAAFSGTTSNAGNAFEAGAVTIEDNDGSSAMFVLGDGPLAPGSTVSKCIRVTYTGNLSADVALYKGAAALGGTGLESYLDLTIEEGTDDGSSVFPNCAGFTPSAGGEWFNGTLATFASTHTDFATGVTAPPAGWTADPAGPTNMVKNLRFTVEVQDNDLAQGLTATDVEFVWEAQSN